jgi:hypothetical protein
MPADAWDKLKGYHDWGFAVFKLKPGKRTIHPMAFEFPTRTKKLFFPTLHIHDGKVVDRAKFDHSLFLQAEPEGGVRLKGWEESPKVASDFMKVSLTKGTVKANRHCYRKRIHGVRKNVDVVV